MINNMYIVKKYIVCFIFFVGVLTSCDNETIDNAVVNREGTDIVSMELILEQKEFVLKPFLVTDSFIHFVVPHQYDLSNATLTLTHNGDKIYVDGIEQISGKTRTNLSDFANPIQYKVVSSKGEDKIWTVIVYDLPVLIMNTPDGKPITSKEVRTEGCVVQLFDTDGHFYNLGTAGIRGRGSSSWKQEKKPYNLKFDKKQEILGMNKSKHWILLANAYFDRTQLHNATVFEIARMTDMPWVQKGEYVELILNGEHKGLYYLCEKVGAEKGKIEIGEKSPEVLPQDCGYLLESLFCLDERADTTVFPANYFNTHILNQSGDEVSHGFFGWEIKEPEDNTESQYNYIQNYMINLEKMIRDSLELGSYREFFDLESAANWWLVEELCLNEEASRTKNVYLYKPSGSKKISMGPPWDLDAWTFGMYGTKKFWANKTTLYFNYLFKDPAFVAIVKSKWRKYKQDWMTKIPLYIDEQYEKIYRSALRNEKMWTKWNGLNYYGIKTYEEIVEDMKSSFMEQLQWMDQQIESFS